MLYFLLREQYSLVTMPGRTFALLTIELFKHPTIAGKHLYYTADSSVYEYGVIDYSYPIPVISAFFNMVSNINDLVNELNGLVYVSETNAFITLDSYSLNTSFIHGFNGKNNGIWDYVSSSVLELASAAVSILPNNTSLVPPKVGPIFQGIENTPEIVEHNDIENHTINNDSDLLKNTLPQLKVLGEKNHKLSSDIREQNKRTGKKTIWGKVDPLTIFNESSYVSKTVGFKTLHNDASKPFSKDTVHKVIQHSLNSMKKFGFERLKISSDLANYITRKIEDIGTFTPFVKQLMTLLLNLSVTPTKHESFFQALVKRKELLVFGFQQRTREALVDTCLAFAYSMRSLWVSGGHVEKAMRIDKTSTRVTSAFRIYAERSYALTLSNFSSRLRDIDMLGPKLTIQESLPCVYDVDITLITSDVTTRLIYSAQAFLSIAKTQEQNVMFTNAIYFIFYFFEYATLKGRLPTARDIVDEQVRYMKDAAITLTFDARPYSKIPTIKTHSNGNNTAVIYNNNIVLIHTSWLKQTNVPRDIVLTLAAMESLSPFITESLKMYSSSTVGVNISVSLPFTNDITSTSEIRFLERIKSLKIDATNFTYNDYPRESGLADVHTLMHWNIPLDCMVVVTIEFGKARGVYEYQYYAGDGSPIILLMQRKNTYVFKVPSNETIVKSVVRVSPDRIVNRMDAHNQTLTLIPHSDTLKYCYMEDATKTLISKIAYDNVNLHMTPSYSISLRTHGISIHSTEVFNPYTKKRQSQNLFCGCPASSCLSSSFKFFQNRAF